jgi:lysophospholipase L1-like esterase
MVMMGKRRLVFQLIIGVTIIVATLFAKGVGAESSGWLAGVISGEAPDYLSNNQDAYGLHGQCSYENVELAGMGSDTVCVYEAKSYEYTMVGGQLYIRVGGDQKMYRVGNDNFAPSLSTVASAQSDTFVLGPYVWRDLLGKLKLNTQGSTTVYDAVSHIENLTIDDQGRDHIAYGNGSVSRNGKWEVLVVPSVGLIRVNLIDLSMTWFAPFQGTGELSAISNNGRYVATTKSLDSPRIYDLDNCGQTANKLQSSWFGRELSSPCPSRSLTEVANMVLGTSWLTSDARPEFSDDDQQLTLFVHPNGVVGPDGKSGKGVILSAPGYTAAPRLDYLALGDSISSGEGDTELKTDGTKYYLPFTNVTGDTVTPQEKCHISNRSYPYQLASGMTLASKPLSWKSVACSGATAWDVKSQGQEAYVGQGDRLKGFNAEILKTQALNEFIPGRQKQIEFVKKYKPKVITLTMGGNDIGFGDRMKACALSVTTCDLTSVDGRASFSKSIRDQYDNLKKLYEDLYKEAGSQPKIYVLGYPQIINSDPNSTCSALNIGILNGAERELVGNSITYFNDVIEQAAKAAGVKYVDTEQSLAGHKLCDSGSASVNGVTGILGWGSNDLIESFHPNAKGQNEIALTVWDQVNRVSLLDYSYCAGTITNHCPDSTATKDTIPVPDYFKVAQHSQENIQYSQFTSGDKVKGQLANLSIKPFSFDPGTNVAITLHSDPIDLGSYTATDDGSLVVSTMIPSTAPAGVHLLVATGKTYAG